MAVIWTKFFLLLAFCSKFRARCWLLCWFHFLSKWSQIVLGAVLHCRNGPSHHYSFGLRHTIGISTINHTVVIGICKQNGARRAVFLNLGLNSHTQVCACPQWNMWFHMYASDCRCIVPWVHTSRFVLSVILVQWSCKANGTGKCLHKSFAELENNFAIIDRPHIPLNHHFPMVSYRFLWLPMRP